MSSCPSCGRRLPNEALYCGFCGGPLEAPGARPFLDHRAAFLTRRPRKEADRTRRDQGASHQDPQALTPAGAASPMLRYAAAAAQPGSRIAVSVSEPYPVWPWQVVLDPPRRRLLRLLLLVAGGCFWGIFLMPLIWRSGALASPSWLQDVPLLRGLPFLRRSFPLVAGTLLLLTGLLPVPPRLRGLLSSLIGGLALVLLASFASWRSTLLLCALLLLAAGLLQKRAFPFSRLAPAAIMAGVGGVLTALLFPLEGQVPLLANLDQLPAGSILELVYHGLPLLLLIVALLASLAAFSSYPTRWVSLGALLALLYLPAHTLLKLILSQPLGSSAPLLASQLSLVLSIQLALLLVAVGLFQLVSPRAAIPPGG